MDLIRSKLTFRSAVVEDLPAMLSLLNEDILGSQRESLDAAAYAKYESAFYDIRAQDGNQVLLAMLADEIVGMLQLTFIPGLSHQGEASPDRVSTSKSQCTRKRNRQTPVSRGF